tara:strand:+ start:260701 stop:261477 length:777 start_codon:yes stop_codon:yes gene_type:complete
MNYIKVASFFLLILSLLSCGAGKKVPGALDENISSKELIDLHKKSEVNFSTLAARVNVNYDDGEKSQSMTVSLRVEKDKTIWVSASILGITMAKLIITPDHVSYYETIGKTYFDGDFRLLSSWLAVDIDFEMAQNILLGNAVLPMEAKSYTASVSNNDYRLTPKNSQELFKHIFLINPLNYKMASQQIMQPQEQRVLTIDYSSYQEINQQFFPKEIRINAIEINNQTRIILDYRNIDLEANVSFPFKIPNGYSEIRLD